MTQSKSIPFWGDRITKQSRAVPIPEPDETAGPIEILTAASGETLEAIRMNRLNTANNLRKDIALLIANLADNLAEAKVAEMLLAQRKRQKQEALSEPKRDT